MDKPLPPHGFFVVVVGFIVVVVVVAFFGGGGSHMGFVFKLSLIEVKGFHAFALPFLFLIQCKGVRAGLCGLPQHLFKSWIRKRNLFLIFFPLEKKFHIYPPGNFQQRNKDVICLQLVSTSNPQMIRNLFAF